VALELSGVSNGSYRRGVPRCALRYAERSQPGGYFCKYKLFFMPAPPNRQLPLLYTIILVDVIVGAAVGPVLPEFVRGLRQPQLWLSLGTGIFLGVQLFSAPLLGRLSDGYGRRPIFILSAVGTVLANALLLPVRAGLYFANRVSDGFTNGLYATVRSAITDLSPPERLFRNLGIEGAIASLGFVLGPMTTGFMLTALNVPPGLQATYVVRLAVGLALLNVLFSLWLPETHRQPSGIRGAELRAELVRSVNPLTLWARLQAKDAANPGIRRIKKGTHHNGTSLSKSKLYALRLLPARRSHIVGIVLTGNFIAGFIFVYRRGRNRVRRWSFHNSIRSHSLASRSRYVRGRRASFVTSPPPYHHGGANGACPWSWYQRRFWLPAASR
jgi:MFS family permease